MPSYTEKLSSLSLSQKILLLSGENSWATPGIPEAGIPPLKVTDGPVGARGASLTAGASACFPAGVSAGAMWNPDLVAEMGRALAAEAKLKGAYVLLGPMINLQRTPIGGRNFECFSEDPHLTAELAIAYVNALQAEGIGACPKHYVGNDTEYRRHDISSNIDDATLHDVYLHPFERLVKEANPWTIMAAYNAVNGVSMCSHEDLLINLLKDQWGYDGLVISDWRAAKDTVDCVKGGLDLEMPGPSDVWGDKLHTAIENGDVSESDLDDKITRYLRLLDRVRPKPELVPETGVDKPEDRALIRRAAAEAMVLLKNDDQILPFDPAKVKKLAIIGPNAAVGQTMGGGSATVNSHPPVHPLAGLTAAFPDSEIIHSVGCTSYRFVPTFEEGSIATPQGVPFFLKEEFETDDFSGEPILSPWPNVGIALLMGKNGDHGDSGTKSMRLTGNYTPTHNGLRQLGLVSIGRSRMMVDDELVVDNWDNWTQGTTLFGYGSEEARADYTFEAGQTYKITIEYTHARERGIQILRFGINTPLDDDPIAKAAQAAADADEAILILGSHADWESEGCDRESMELPGHQNELAEAVLAANPNTAIIVNVGSPVSMPWYDKAKSVLISWFPGEEMGNTIGDVVSGASEPSGRLPFTWPKRLEDHPCYSTYPGSDDLQMLYSEGRLCGHRWYEKNGIEPLAAFGSGIGYGDVQIDAASAINNPANGVSARLTVTVKNSASRDTLTTVQVYAETPNAGPSEPDRRLVGFKKVLIPAKGETTTTIDVLETSLAEWDNETRVRKVRPGNSFKVGLSSADYASMAIVEE